MKLINLIHLHHFTFPMMWFCLLQDVGKEMSPNELAEFTENDHKTKVHHIAFGGFFIMISTCCPSKCTIQLTDGVMMSSIASQNKTNAQ